MQRAVAIDLAWAQGGFGACRIGLKSLDFEEDFPGCWVHDVHYLHGLGLALASLQDVYLNSVRYVTVYRISPPQQLAVWDAGHGHVSCKRAILLPVYQALI